MEVWVRSEKAKSKAEKFSGRAEMADALNVAANKAEYAVESFIV